MTPANTKRRRDALRGALTATVVQVLTAAVLLWARLQGGVPGFVSLLLLVLAIADLGAIVPIWINLRIRLKEIQGGEEDAAAEYWLCTR